jgi:hypothetical protein
MHNAWARLMPILNNRIWGVSMWSVPICPKLYAPPFTDMHKPIRSAFERLTFQK